MDDETCQDCGRPIDAPHKDRCPIAMMQDLEDDGYAVNLERRVDGTVIRVRPPLRNDHAADMT